MRYDLVVRIAVAVSAVVVTAACGTSSPASAPASSSAASSGVLPSSGAATPGATGASTPSAAPSAPAAGTPAAQPPVLSAPSTTAAAPPRPADKGAAYLSALTAAGVPTSTSGATEIQIAQRVCGELAKGTPRTKLVDDIALLGGLMTEDQADAMVTAAETTYC